MTSNSDPDGQPPLQSRLSAKPLNWAVRSAMGKFGRHWNPTTDGGRLLRDALRNPDSVPELIERHRQSGVRVQMLELKLAFVALLAGWPLLIFASLLGMGLLVWTAIHRVCCELIPQLFGL